MYVKSSIVSLVLALSAAGASAQLVRPGTRTNDTPTPPAPQAATAAPAAAAPAPAAAPVAAPVTAASAPLAPVVAAPAQTPALGSPAAQESIRAAALRARQEEEAAKSAAAAGVPAIKVTRDGHAPVSASGLSEPRAKEPAEPRLVSIVGAVGRERVEISYDGVIYTVSRTSPRLGGTGWNLVDVDSAGSSVRIERSEDKASAPKKTAKRDVVATPKGLTVGFSRKEADLSNTANPSMSVVR